MRPILYSRILARLTPAMTRCTTLSVQIAHSNVDLQLKEVSEFLHCSVMNKNLTQCKFLLHWAAHMRYKSYTQVSRSTYTHKIQPSRIRPIEPIASESASIGQT